MSVRDLYCQYGVDNYYKKHSNSYNNPYLKEIHSLLYKNLKNINKDDSILDLCSGNGEVTTLLVKNGYQNIIGCDPYMNNIYEEKTNKKCYKYSFIDIINYKLDIPIDIVICSFGLHLCEKNNIKMLLNALKYIGMTKLIIITPNKKPDISQYMKLKYIDNQLNENKKSIYMYVYE